MPELSAQLPAIIAEAAKSPLGIFAVMIISLAILGFFFFKEASERTRIAIFVLLFVGVAVFGLSIVRTTAGMDSVPPATGGTIPASGASDPSVKSILGSWTAEVTYAPPRSFTESFEFELFGDELITTATFLGSRRGVVNSRVENGIVRFEIARQEIVGSDTRDVRSIYTGQLNGDRIDFLMQDDRGENRSGFRRGASLRSRSPGLRFARAGRMISTDRRTMPARSSRKGALRRKAPSTARCRRKFLRFFPGGFRDETYLDWERNYKAAAHEYEE